MDVSPIWILLASVVLFALSLGAFVRVRPQMPKRSTASKVKLLTKVPGLSSLSHEQLERVAMVMRELLVPVNVYVIRQNRAGDSMFFIISGQIAILKRGAHEDTLIQTVGPGDLIGEMALLTGARRIASARTLTPCHLLEIDRGDFLDLIASNGEAMATVWGACEVHSIGLVMADHQSTRAIPPAERERWIKSRTSEVTAADQRLKPPFDGFIAVIVGAVSIGELVFESPALVRVTANDEVDVAVPGRVCWLPHLG